MKNPSINNDKKFFNLKNNKFDLPKSRLIIDKSLKKNSEDNTNNELNITDISKISYISPLKKNEVFNKSLKNISLSKNIEKESKGKTENNEKNCIFSFAIQINFLFYQFYFFSLFFF